MSQSLCVSWPHLGWMGEDHGLWIKGLGEMLASTHGDARVEMLSAGDEAGLSPGAGDGADPWQGDIGGAV